MKHPSIHGNDIGIHGQKNPEILPVIPNPVITPSLPEITPDPVKEQPEQPAPEITPAPQPEISPTKPGSLG